MEKGERICKICGEKYPYCTTKNSGKFRWQDVACCVEHAEEYLKKIEEARNGNTGNAQPLQQEDLVSAVAFAEPQEEQSELKAELETKEIDDERNSKINNNRRKRRRK